MNSVALYCDGQRIGCVAATSDVSVDLARRLGARLVELGEVREAPTVTAFRVTDWGGDGDAA